MCVWSDLRRYFRAKPLARAKVWTSRSLYCRRLDQRKDRRFPFK